MLNYKKYCGLAVIGLLLSLFNFIPTQTKAAALYVKVPYDNLGCPSGYKDWRTDKDGMVCKLSDPSKVQVVKPAVTLAQRCIERYTATCAGITKARHNKAARGPGGAAGPVGTPHPNTPVTQIPIDTTLPKVTPNPNGDITIITYVDDPTLDNKGIKDKRLGGVDITISREGGNEKCDNHKSKGTTNRTHTQLHNGQKVLTKGTLHFIGCNTGRYTVTLKGRKNYVAESPITKSFNLEDDKVAQVYFVLKPAPKPVHSNPISH